MNVELLEQKRAIDLTAKELAEIIISKLPKLNLTNDNLPSYSYKGIGGIMEIFQCSKSKANAIRASGIIDDACVQYGNSFLVDKHIALDLMKRKGE